MLLDLNFTKLLFLEMRKNRLLVTLCTGWRVEMALWMKKVHDAEEAEKLDGGDEVHIAGIQHLMPHQHKMKTHQPQDPLW